MSKALVDEVLLGFVILVMALGCTMIWNLSGD
jgi:branched-subunit amino acid ABC-type transport system permease component